MTPTIIANRYEVQQQLGAGGMGAVWLVRDKLRQQPVALKQVLMAYDEMRLAITREFRTLSTLRHPNIVSVIEYGFHDSQPYFTMEYLPQVVPFDEAAEPKLERFSQILQALGYLHRRGILHRDLKPGNVVVMPDGVVKLLDFGLALDTRRDISDETGGTLPYMAPELFAGEPASVGSDLWALGIMLCQALLNRHPFGDPHSAALLMSIVSRPPDLRGIQPALTPVVERLLAKDSADRYASALDVIRDLCAATGTALPPETQAHRESFLQAAAFVGRDTEYHYLLDGLTAAAGGTFQLWLIGGEAGVGKSRLLDEVRTRALVDGFLVLQGQAVEGGGLPYQVWRDPARKLVLGAPVSNLTASVLKELVPDIGALLEREVAALPALDPKANRDRLAAALVERLRALASPVLIILEDLHWTHDGLDLLRLLVAQLEGLPVMVIGSFRNDERPDLPQELPDARLLTVARLSPEAVAALSASMIGAKNATPQLVERLAAETEGNALFMVEVMRALAEEAGSLQDITHQTLPARILAGGMVALLRRRLARVPTWALELLKLAAVIGREIDIPVLQAAGGINIEHWLQACSDAAVLEPYQGEWRFSHDRLREVLLHDLNELAPLHEQAALAIEAVYPDDVNYAEALADHWRIAGNPDREVLYILKAAEQLVMISGDYERAETLVQRGLNLDLLDTRAELLLWQGFAAEKQGRFDSAIDLYQTGLAAVPRPGVRVPLLNRSGHVCLRQGRYAESGDYVRQARAIAEQHDDQPNIALSLHLLGLLARYQGDYPTARVHYENSLRIWRQLGNKKGIADNLNNLGMVAMHQGDYATAHAYYDDSLRIRREIGERQGIAIALNNLGVIALFQGDYTTARAYYEESLELAHEIGDQSGVAGCLNNLGGIAQAQGDYKASRAYYEGSREINHKIGDRQNLAISLHNLGVLADIQGDFEAARQFFADCLVTAREIGNPETVVYGTSGLVIVLAQSGERDAARNLLIESVKTARDMATVPMMMYALLGAAYWQPEAAWIGLLLEHGGIDIHDDLRFKRLSDRLRAGLGAEAYEAAVAHGRTLDARAEVERLLAELTR